METKYVKRQGCVEMPKVSASSKEHDSSFEIVRLMKSIKAILAIIAILLLLGVLWVLECKERADRILSKLDDIYERQGRMRTY